MKVNDFAVLVSEKEGGKKNMSIAQIKEVIKITKDILKAQTDVDIYALIRKID